MDADPEASRLLQVIGRIPGGSRADVPVAGAHSWFRKAPWLVAHSIFKASNGA